MFDVETVLSFVLFHVFQMLGKDLFCCMCLYCNIVLVTRVLTKHYSLLLSSDKR